MVYLVTLSQLPKNRANSYAHYPFHNLRELIRTDLLVEHMLMANFLLLGAAPSAVAFARSVLLRLILRNVREGTSPFLVGGTHLLRGALGRRSITLLSVGSNHLQYVCTSHTILLHLDHPSGTVLCTCIGDGICNKNSSFSLTSPALLTSLVTTLLPLPQVPWFLHTTSVGGLWIAPSASLPHTCE